MTEPIFIAYVAAVAGVLGAVIGAGASLVGVWITQRNQTKTRESEERRWHLDYYLPRRLDALCNLQSVILESFHSLHFWDHRHSSPQAEDACWEIVKQLHRAWGTAQIYLDQEGTKLVATYEEALRKETDNIVASTRSASRAEYDPTDSWVAAYVACEEYFQQVLDPATLEQIEKDKW